MKEARLELGWFYLTVYGEFASQACSHVYLLLGPAMLASACTSDVLPIATSVS